LQHGAHVQIRKEEVGAQRLRKRQLRYAGARQAGAEGAVHSAARQPLEGRGRLHSVQQRIHLICLELGNCKVVKQKKVTIILLSNVVDPNPYVFEPPGSGSSYHQAKIVRTILIPTIL
jgi:hypothetical protein